MSEETLSVMVTVKVRFSEADPIGVVWHGNYIRYFEDGREAFGEKYDLGYLDVFKNNFLTPLVKINCEYLSPLRYGESAIIETRFINSRAAKIVFEYSIYRESDNEKVATGSSTQVFVTKKGEMSIIIPDFFERWKQKYGLL